MARYQVRMDVEGCVANDESEGDGGAEVAGERESRQSDTPYAVWSIHLHFRHDASLL